MMKIKLTSCQFFYSSILVGNPNGNVFSNGCPALLNSSVRDECFEWFSRDRHLTLETGGANSLLH
jgi:hypothetical protein